jgi:hypothetical protein
MFSRSDTPDGEDEILLDIGRAPSSSSDHLREVVANSAGRGTPAAAQTHVVTRERSDPEWAHPANTPFFYEMAFPHLFPYGRGGPGDATQHKLNDTQFMKHVLKMGFDRRFQQCATFVFTAYHYFMGRRLGGVALRAARDDLDDAQAPADDDDVPTVAAGELVTALDELERAAEHDLRDAGAQAGDDDVGADG